MRRPRVRAAELLPYHGGRAECNDITDRPSFAAFSRRFDLRAAVKSAIRNGMASESKQSPADILRSEIKRRYLDAKWVLWRDSRGAIARTEEPDAFAALAAEGTLTEHVTVFCDDCSESVWAGDRAEYEAEKKFIAECLSCSARLDPEEHGLGIDWKLSPDAKARFDAERAAKPDRSLNSITNLYTAICEAHEVAPDLRVGQIIVNAVGGDPFSVENGALAEHIRAWVGSLR